MKSRYAAIWFRNLLTDQRAVRMPELKDTAFVLAAPSRGRMVITASSVQAEKKGILPGMVLADARAVFPGLTVLEDKPGLAVKLLCGIGQWALRFTPIVAVDGPDGLLLDITGCAHLWGSEKLYLADINHRLNEKGYHVRCAIADTPAAAWANSRYGRLKAIIEPEGQALAIFVMPPAALRIDPPVIEKLEKLGFYQLANLIDMPRSVLRRRFGPQLLLRLDQTLGLAPEPITAIEPDEPYIETLPCLEAIRSGPGIEMAIQKLLEAICQRLSKESRGLRKAVLTAHRMDGSRQQIHIGTHGASCSIQHLLKLFALQVPKLRPDLGFELFELEALMLEDTVQDTKVLFAQSASGDSAEIAELLDTITAKTGQGSVSRYLPDEHYWPERSVKVAGSLQQMPVFKWPTERPRPISLLTTPEKIHVTAPVPDYPPMLFRYLGVIHNVIKADGPERIEQEWWIQAGLHRDYYIIEDHQGARYWIFRLGHYGKDLPDWFLHGFFP